MKSFLAKITLRKAIGLCLGDHSLTISQVAGTLLGPVETYSVTEPYTAENLPEVLERLLKPLLGRKQMAPVSVGIAPSRLFLSTRLIRAGTDVTPEGVMHKSLSTANIAVADLAVDLLRGKALRNPVATVAACRKKYMTGLIDTLSKLGVRPYRVEPMPCAMVRTAVLQCRTPRRSKMMLRIFLGATDGLAVMVSGGLPICWKSFNLPSFSEAFAIMSAARTIQTQSKYYGVEVSLDHIVIHGREELHERLQQEQLPTELGVRVVWHRSPALDGANAAFGLAMGCISQDTRAFDLARNLKARAPIKEIFPYKELGFAATMVCAMGVVMGAHAIKLEEECVTVKAENSQHVCLASNDVSKLEKEKKTLQEEVEAANSFLDTRTRWTSFVQDISKNLPSQATISMFKGNMSMGGGKKASVSAKSGFQVQGTAPMTKDGTIPEETQSYLTTLSKNTLWNSIFSSIVTDIKLPVAGAESPEVTFSINCECKSKTAPKSKKKKE